MIDWTQIDRRSLYLYFSIEVGNPKILGRHQLNGTPPSLKPNDRVVSYQKLMYEITMRIVAKSKYRSTWIVRLSYFELD